MRSHTTNDGIANDVPTPGRYVQASKLFELSGHWPLPRGERTRLLYGVANRYKLPAWYGTRTEPPLPPRNLTERQVGIINARITVRGWQITKGRGGAWSLVRVGDF